MSILGSWTQKVVRFNPLGEGGGGYTMKVCSKPRKILTLLYISFEKRHSFLYLPLKNCTLFEYLLYKNKSARQEVFRLSVIFVQLLTEFNDVPLRRVSSKPFNKRPLMKDFPLLHILQLVTFLPFDTSDAWNSYPSGKGCLSDPVYCRLL